MLFRHPHLLRGIVHTGYGAFVINRGVADLPEEIGDSLGWLRVDGPQDTGRLTPQREQLPSSAADGPQGR
jgi:hypothetical protein